MEMFKRLWKVRGKDEYTNVEGARTRETNLVYNIKTKVVCYKTQDIEEEKVITFLPLYVNENGEFCIFSNKHLVGVKFSISH